MYSKKINQLATNLNPQSTDLIAIGDAETGQLKTTTYNLLSGVSSDGVISGGIVTWTGTGLVFNISACVYYLNGVRYSSQFSTKTLAAADPTNPRIDVFAVNTSGQVEVIQGTPAENPIEPEGDTATTLGLTNVTINAGATTPSGVAIDLIYDENVESWTKTFEQNFSTVNYANTAFAYTGTKSILATQSFGYLYLNFSKAVALDISNYKSLSFAIRLNSALNANTVLNISFFNGVNPVSNSYSINSTNTVGFNRNLSGIWQLITIPLDGTIIKFTSNKFTLIRIATINGTITYRIDTIQLNSGISNPTGGATTSTNSFGFVNGSTGSAASTQATDTLNVVGTGLITTSASGKTLTIASNQIATNSILGRVTAGTGNVETLTGTQTTTLLNVFTSSLKGLAPASGGGTTNFLRADGTWAAPSGGGGMSIGGSITSATAGSVLFAGVGGILQQDNANFFWDDTNNRLGIGTATPDGKLNLVTSSTTTYPTYLGDVNAYSFYLRNSSATTATASLISFGNGSDSYTSYFGAEKTANSSDLVFGGRPTAGGSFVERMRLASGGNVGIGTTSPTANLEIVKNTNAYIYANISNPNTGNTAAAEWRATSNATGYGSIFKIGTGYAGFKNISNSDFGILNTGSGNMSFLNDYSSGNISFSAGGSATPNVIILSGGNVGIGTTINAGFKLDVNGTFRSQGAATFASTATFTVDAIINSINIGRGGGSIASNIRIGTSALNANTTGLGNTAIGNSALAANTTQSYSIAVGTSSLIQATASSNISIGYEAMFSNSTGDANVSIGHQALLNNSTGATNVAIGYRAGGGTGTPNPNTTGANNIFIGNQAGGESATESNRTWIGNTSTTTTWVGGSLLIGTRTDAASAILNVTSTTKGFLPPRMTTTQKNAIATPAAGLVVYDTTTNKLCCYNGTTWNDLF